VLWHGSRSSLQPTPYGRLTWFLVGILRLEHRRAILQQLCEQSRVRDKGMSDKWQLALAILLMVAFAFLDWRLGQIHEEWFAGAMPFVFLAALFLLVVWALDRHQQEIRETLKRHLPETYFVTNNPQYLNAEALATVMAADSFIVCTGGKARTEDYLGAIEKKVLGNPNLEYWRVVLGPYIHHRLHQHLERLYDCPNVHLRWHENEIFGNVLASDKRLVLIFPDPAPGVSGTGQVLPHVGDGTKYKEWVIRLYSEAKDFSKDKIRARCRECCAQTERSTGAESQGAKRQPHAG